MTATTRSTEARTTAGAPGEVSPRHRFDERRLQRYLQSHIEDFGADMEVRQFQGGASNPTFLLSTNSTKSLRRYVLRKKPSGPLLSSAHQVEREHRVMAALAGHVPVPRMRLFCEDTAVIGTAFYVMDFLEGRIFRNAGLPGLSQGERAAIYDQMNMTLAGLHALDPSALGRPTRLALLECAAAQRHVWRPGGSTPRFRASVRRGRQQRRRRVRSPTPSEEGRRSLRARRAHGRTKASCAGQVQSNSGAAPTVGRRECAKRAVTSDVCRRQLALRHLRVRNPQAEE